MRNILLFFMSSYKPTIQNGCYSRAQTNEAVLRKLQGNKDTRPDMILALCSESVRNNADVNDLHGGANITTLQYFTQTALPKVNFPPQNFVSIPVPDTMNESAQAAAIHDIVQNVQPGDTLYIDLSGGKRDTAMLFVAVARYLRDIRDVKAHVLYSELGSDDTPDIRDSDKLYDLFDLISATDAFSTTGRAKRLIGYLRSSSIKSEKTTRLLAAIETFSEDLLLCKASRLTDDIADMKNALSDLLKDPGVTRNRLDTLLYDLLNEEFKKEFRSLEKKKGRELPTLARWCLDHDMFQQAFTLLSEQMPEFVCRHIFVRPTQAGLAFLKKQPQNKGKNWSYPLFHFHFCRAALMKREIEGDNKSPILYTADLRLNRNAPDSDETSFFRIAEEKELDEYLDRSVREGLLLFDEAQRGNLMNAILCYQKVQQFRNQINHASDTAGLLPLTIQNVRDVLQETCSTLEEIVQDVPNADGEPLLSLTDTLNG